MTMTANKSSGSSHSSPSVTIVDTSKVQRILLSDGWHDVRNCQLVPYSVGSSPQSDYRSALRFTDTKTNQEMIIDKRAVQGYVGPFAKEINS